MKIRDQIEWKIVRQGGNLFGVSIAENERLFEVFRKYKSYSQAPDDVTFEAYPLVKDTSDNYYCDGKNSVDLLVNKLEPFYYEA